MVWLHVEDELYSGLQPHAVDLSIDKFTPQEISVKENINMEQVEEEQIFCDNIKRIFERQYENYKVIFRDGQYTQAREFNFIKKMEIKLKQSGTQENNLVIDYALKAQDPNYFKIDLTNSCQYNTPEIKEKLEKMFKKSEYQNEVQIVSRK